MPDAHDGTRVIFDIANTPGVEFPWLCIAVMAATALAALWAFTVLRRRQMRSRLWRLYALGTIVVMIGVIIATSLDYCANVRLDQRVRRWPMSMRPHVAEGAVLKLRSGEKVWAGDQNPTFRIGDVEFEYGTWSVNTNVSEDLIEGLSEQGVHIRVFYTDDLMLRIESTAATGPE